MIAYHLRKVLVVFVCMGLCISQIIAQTKPLPLAEALKKITQKHGTQFVYDSELLKGKQTSYDFSANKSPEEMLKAILYPHDLVFLYVKPNYYTVISKSRIDNEENAALTVTSSGMAAAAANTPQKKTVSGTVADSSGTGIPGVTITETGTKNSVATLSDGSFSITVSRSDAVLNFSSIGFISQDVSVSGRTTINIRLQTEASNLTEVVVIGYGTQKKGEVTSSVATVKAENFTKGVVLDAGQLLQGKVAGLSIASPSGDPTSGSQILLRGSTTILGANANPLVLIDGIPGDLKTVAPEDIESIDVLKDGSAAAIYGTRGTNGVIIVTTRRASGTYTNAVEYSGSVSTQTIARKLDMLTADDYRAQIAAGDRDANYDLGSSTNWLDEISQTPITHVHNLTFRGGNSTTNYLANVNFRFLEGIFRKSDNNTFTGRVDINHNMFNNKLKFNFGIISSQNRYNTTGDGVSFSGYTYRQALIRNPTAPVYNDDGTWHEETGQFNYENPLARIFESDGRNTSQNNRYNTNITFLPTRGLRLNALLSYTKYNQSRGYAETKQHISNLRDSRNGFASIGGVESIDRLMELTAEYSKSISDHRFSLLGGYSYQENDSKNHWMQNWDFPTDLFSYNNMGTGKALKEGLAPIYSYRGVTNLIGFFGRMTYSYKDKYLLLGSLRYEAASQLYGTEKPWGLFPALSVGWRLTREAFMENQTLFDDIKLRAGYGVTGTQPSNLFLGVALLNYGSFYYMNGQWIQTLTPSQNPNPNLRWEEKHESNIGMDFSMLKGRISGSVDYYIRNINGLLYDYQVPSPPNLYSTTRANVGKMQNKGIEVILNFMPVQTKSFVWNTSVNFSSNTNKLVSLSNDAYKLTNNYFTTGGTGEPIQTFTHIVEIGNDIGSFYGFKVIDVDADGKWIYEGRDGKPVNYDDFDHAFEDKKVLGNGLPKYYAGWNNNFRYKDFDLGITMRGAFGFQILNFQRMYYENTNIQQYNRLKSAYDPVFGKEVLSKDMPLEFNSYYVEDGDFWKVDNITLGYNFRKMDGSFIKSARIYVSTLNSLLFTGYKGIDPEVNRLGLSPGNDDRDKYPTTRTYTLGVNLNF
ncbi:MAG: SusC/RagA family TonB-linked outer membrane protein [Chitinophagaceae bacterium]